MCALAMTMCHPPMIMHTPLDSAGCIIGCPECVTEIPQSCGVAVELCKEDNPNCIVVAPCDNSDQILLAEPCSQVDCVFTESMEKVQPCARDCVNITRVENDGETGECDKLTAAMTITDRTTGQLVLMNTGEECNLENGQMYYGSYAPSQYMTIDAPEWISADLLPCAREFYVSGDLICYCECDGHDYEKSPSPAPPNRENFPSSPPPTPPPSLPPSPPPKRVSSPPRRAGIPPPRPIDELPEDPVVICHGDKPGRDCEAHTGSDKESTVPTSESACLLAGHGWDHDTGKCIKLHPGVDVLPVKPIRNTEVLRDVDALTSVLVNMTGVVQRDVIHISIKYTRYSTRTVDEELRSCLARPLVVNCLVSKILGTTLKLQAAEALYDYEVDLMSKDPVDLASVASAEVMDANSIQDMNIEVAENRTMGYKGSVQGLSVPQIGALATVSVGAAIGVIGYARWKNAKKNEEYHDGDDVTFCNNPLSN